MNEMITKEKIVTVTGCYQCPYLYYSNLGVEEGTYICTAGGCDAEFDVTTEYYNEEIHKDCPMTGKTLSIKEYYDWYKS